MVVWMYMSMSPMGSVAVADGSGCIYLDLGWYGE